MGKRWCGRRRSRPRRRPLLPRRRLPLRQPRCGLRRHRLLLLPLPPASLRPRRWRNRRRPVTPRQAHGAATAAEVAQALDKFRSQWSVSDFRASFVHRSMRWLAAGTPKALPLGNPSQTFNHEGHVMLKQFGAVGKSWPDCACRRNPFARPVVAAWSAPCRQRRRRRRGLARGGG